MSATSLTIGDVHSRLVNKSAEFVQEISADNITRKSNVKNHITLLNEGTYNGSDYYFILKDNNQTKRVEWMKKNDFSLHGYASPNYFKMVPLEGFTSARKVATFVLKKGVLASEALHQIKKGLTLMGCGEACQIAQYLAIEDILKSEKFNLLFAADSQTPLIIGSALDNNPLSRLRNYMKKEVNPGSAEIKKGDHVYLTNAKTYTDKHLTGGSRGYNVICVDDTVGAQKFTTLGLPSQGVTHSEFQDTAISRYNLPYRSMESYSEITKAELCAELGSATLERAKWMADTQITLEEFQAQEGGRILILDELDTQRIAALANASLEDARKLLDSYDVRLGERQVTFA